MVTKTVPQTAAQEPSEPEDDRPYASFTFNDRDVELYEPREGQRFILMQVIGVADEDAPDQERMELVLGFGQMLRALFVSPAVRQSVTGALARGEAELDDYFDLARQMAEHWAIADEVPANRAERRAAPRRPAKAMPRPRGGPARRTA